MNIFCCVALTAFSNEFIIQSTSVVKMVAYMKEYSLNKHEIILYVTDKLNFDHYYIYQSEDLFGCADQWRLLNFHWSAKYTIIFR